MLLLSLIINSWQKHFPLAPEPTVKKDEIHTNHLTISFRNAHILDCFFNNIMGNSNGGAINMGNMDNLLIEFTTFLSCKTTGTFGGAIYFVCKSTGCLIVSTTCAYACCCSSTSDSNGQFASDNVSPNKNNSIIDCSIINTNQKIGDEHDTLNLHYGFIAFYRDNITSNCINQGSAIGFYHYSNGSVLMSSFINNTAIVDNLMILESSIEFDFKMSNIVKNKCLVIAKLWGNIFFYDSCFLSNVFTFYFKSDVKSTGTLIGCTLEPKYEPQAGVTVKNTPKTYFRNELYHFITFNCPLTDINPIDVTLTMTKECTDFPLHLRKRINTIFNVI